MALAQAAMTNAPSRAGPTGSNARGVPERGAARGGSTTTAGAVEIHAGRTPPLVFAHFARLTGPKYPVGEMSFARCHSFTAAIVSPP